MCGPRGCLGRCMGTGGDPAQLASQSVFPQKPMVRSQCQGSLAWRDPQEVDAPTCGCQWMLGDQGVGQTQSGWCTSGMSHSRGAPAATTIRLGALALAVLPGPRFSPGPLLPWVFVEPPEPGCCGSSFVSSEEQGCSCHPVSHGSIYCSRMFQLVLSIFITSLGCSRFWLFWVNQL